MKNSKRKGECALFFMCLAGVILMLVGIDWGVKALELLFYKWVLGF
ncbi:hypothetical protein [Vibrio phage vB_VpP_HA1]|uniref:Uncharacterized protein n=1 Tax=Vibrio phage vB_VpP_HA1 TaxID=2980503 RepID=A0A977Q6C9_9CAUD|nr:hypothetical protein [Vibrio phage vB_VpP_HA1]